MRHSVCYAIARPIPLNGDDPFSTRLISLPHARLSSFAMSVCLEALSHKPGPQQTHSQDFYPFPRLVAPLAPYGFISYVVLYTA